jgi:hypothetical protein
MNTIPVRATAILLHLLLNFLLVTWLMDFDLTGGWAPFALFVTMCLLLLMAFVVHMISFIRYLQSK